MTFGNSPAARPSGRLLTHWPTTELNSIFVNGLVLGALVYTLLFDFLDDGFRVAIAGLLGLAVVLRCLVSWAHPEGQAATYFVCGLILVCIFQFVFVVDPGVRSAGDYASLALRLMTTIAVLVHFGHERPVMLPRLLVVLCVSVLVAALWAVATGAPVNYADTMRPATFTGGLEGVHSSGYVVTAALVGTIVLWRRGWLGAGRSLAIGLPLLALVAAYQVRTTWLMVSVFIFTSLFLHLRAQGDNKAMILPIGGIIVALLAFTFGGEVNYAEVSSGRTSAYEERLELIAARPPLEFLFGTGPGSEVLPSTIWWWEAKNSHNDFIDLTIQLGVVGLALFLLLLAATWRMLDDVRLPLYMAFVVSSLFSNGLLARPFIAVLFLAFALIPRAPTTDDGD